MTTPPQASPPSALLNVSRFAWAVPLVGLIFAWLRVSAQGGSGTYTQFDKQFYTKGGLTGWQLSPDTYLWIGKDTLIALAATLLASAAFGFLANRLARSAKQPARLPSLLAVGALLAAAPAIGSPLLYLMPKLPPADAVATIPTVESGASSAARPGSFPTGTAGRYAITPYKANLITAQVSAGGDSFEVKLSTLTGDATFDPTNLAAAPIAASFSASLQSLVTGIDLRDQHARDYLKADKFPSLTLAFDKLTHNTIEPNGDTVHFEAAATLSIMGQTLSLPVQGSLKALPPDAVAAEGLAPAPTFLLDASLKLGLLDTPLKESADAFDKPEQPISIRATFILQHQKE
jgi:polyisoprenoid-binding protein YceI